MSKRDKRVDVYIANAPEFAQPILTQIREHVHAACPDVEETIKWSHPHFVYHGVMCGMSAFKQHCGFGFWKAALIDGIDPENIQGSAGSFGRLTSVKDLPTKKALAGFVKQAMQLNVDGVVAPRASVQGVPKKTSASLPVPPAFTAALNKNRAALDSFDAFTASNRKEYIEWIAEAKTDATRDRRILQAVEMLSEGKTRNWKYQK
jgi:uncharacterized protein YdeI (YjbR/CyaY-like superfamily)